MARLCVDEHRHRGEGVACRDMRTQCHAPMMHETLAEITPAKVPGERCRTILGFAAMLFERIKQRGHLQPAMFTLNAWFSSW